MKKILIAIKPQYAEKIFSGEKHYEYRRNLPKEVSVAIVYETAPVKKIVGEFSVNNILVDTIDGLWNLTKDYSGLTEEDYKNYFHGKAFAKALSIDKVFKYSCMYDLIDFGVRCAPQSWQYLKQEDMLEKEG